MGFLVSADLHKDRNVSGSLSPPAKVPMADQKRKLYELGQMLLTAPQELGLQSAATF
jgi:hypothetical protein